MWCSDKVAWCDVYFPFKHQVSYLLIIVFLSSKRLITNQKRSPNAKVWGDLEPGRSTCPCPLGLSLQLCSTQMAPVCSAGPIITPASSEIAWIPNLLYVSPVVMALISEGSVFIPKDTFFLHMFIHLFSGSQIKCKECNISLCYDGGICNACIWAYDCHFS